MDKKRLDNSESVKNSNDEVLTLSEIADYLKVSDKTILRMAQAGEIPSAKVSGQWRFLRSFINDWLETKMYLASTDNLREVVATSDTVVPMSRLLSPDRVVLDLTPGPPGDVLRRLVTPLAVDGVVTDPEEFYRQLVEREEMVSTALGRGVAFPHVRHPAKSQVEAPAVVIGICRAGTDFNSLDGEPTYVFALCCSSSEAMHLRLLAKVTLLLRSQELVEKLRGASNKREVARHLIAADWELSATLPVFGAGA